MTRVFVTRLGRQIPAVIPLLCDVNPAGLAIMVGAPSAHGATAKPQTLSSREAGAY